MNRVMSGCSARAIVCARSRVARVLVLGGLALAVLPASAQARPNPRRSIAFVPIRVWIAGGARPIPVVGATVRIRAPGARGKLLGTGMTYGRGLAIVVASQRLPSRFNAYATGGWIGKQRFRGRLQAQVLGGRSSRVQVINPATTLSGMYCAKRGKLRPAQCDARVARFLSIPKGIDLGELADGQLFNGSIFLGLARRRGGLAKYFTFLVNKLDRGQAPVSFAPRRKSASSLRPAGKAWPGAGVGSGGWLSFLQAASKAGGAVSLVSQLYNIINGSTPSDELADIDSALTQINNELTVLQNELTQLQQELSQNTFSELVALANPYVSPITGVVPDFVAVVDEAAQIGCGDYSKPASAQPTCSSPQSPAQVCTAAAEAANSALQKACVAFGDLPIPAGSVKFYENPDAPAAAVNSLVGVFIRDVVEDDQFDDSNLTTLADDFGGPLAGGVSSTYGVLQQGSALIGQQSPFFGSAQSQQVQALDAYYFNTIVAGLTMRAAYYGFEGLTAGSGLSAALTAYSDLYATTPNPLPAGTFIDENAYTMWSGQLGGVMSQPAYLTQISAGATITLPLTSASNAAPGAQTPTLLGNPISNWSAAPLSELATLYGDVPNGQSGTDGDYFIGTGAGLMWPGLINNGVWDARAVSGPGITYDAESPPSGMSITQTPDYGYLGNGWGRLPVLDVVGCTATGNRNCSEPAWANGSSYGAYDANNGFQMLSVNGTPLIQWSNWSNNQSWCVGHDWAGLCNQRRMYPGITPYLSLPVLYYRTPTASECYYWPESSSSGGSNGCPMGPPPTPPSPSTPSERVVQDR